MCRRKGIPGLLVSLDASSATRGTAPILRKTTIHTARIPTLGWHSGRIASVEHVIAELKELTPDQLDRMAQVVHELAAERSHMLPERQGDARVPESVVVE